ncbi:MAG: AmmeMemoRadiSam system protein B [Syntrophaceae bacterium]|nr:AmmeMemoRadiSam system protein B [Syntrophaceae bacterium]
MAMKAIRKAIIAGSWYPGKPDVLRDGIEKYFSAANLEFKGDIKALIAPHAGYIYSGQVAAYAYGLIRGEKYDTVIVIGPSHRVAFHGVSVFLGGGYETPLGVVPVDEDIGRKIISLNKDVQEIPAAHTSEHSIEIQLPFLQIALGKFSFVPLVMGDQNERTCQNIAQAIHEAAGDKRVLVVGSSDLSHFHDYQKAAKLDSVSIKYLEAADAEGLLDNLSANKTEACGGGPMASSILAAKKMGASKAKVLKYSNSGDVTGDKTSVVGYVSAVYYQ